MTFASIMIIINILLTIAIVVGIFFTIKHLIKYNADLKRRKSQQISTWNSDYTPPIPAYKKSRHSQGA